jgi:hypothetical protein
MGGSQGPRALTLRIGPARFGQGEGQLRPDAGQPPAGRSRAPPAPLGGGPACPAQVARSGSGDWELLPYGQPPDWEEG